jgi:integrase
MATLRRRKGDIWVLDYYDPFDSQRYTISCGTTDENVAKLWLARCEELISRTKLGDIEKVGRLTAQQVVSSRKPKGKRLRLSAYLEVYEQRAEEELKHRPATLEGTRNAIGSLKTSTGNKYAHIVDEEDVRTWIQRLDAQGLTEATKSIYGRSLKAAWNRGMEWGYLESNPFAGVKWPSSRQTRRKDHTPSIEELVKFLKVVDEQSRNPMFPVYTRAVLYTGKRRQEILGLKGEDVSLEKRILNVTTLKRRGGPVRSAVPISEPLYQVLSQVELKEGEYLFQTTAKNKKLKGQPFSKWYATHETKRLLREAKLSENYSLHSLRRAFVNYLRQQDVPPEAITKLLGQASVEVWEHYDETDALDYRHHSEKMDFGDPGLRQTPEKE